MVDMDPARSLGGLAVNQTCRIAVLSHIQEHKWEIHGAAQQLPANEYEELNASDMLRNEYFAARLSRTCNYIEI